MKRLLVAVVIMTAVWAVLGESVGMPGPPWLGFTVFMGVGAIAGGFYARSRFVLVAAGLQLLIWVLIVVALHATAEVPTTYLSIATRNILGLALAVPVAALGAHIGQSLARRGARARAEVA